MNTCWYSHTFTCQHVYSLHSLRRIRFLCFARALEYFHTSMPTAPTVFHCIPRLFNVLCLLMHCLALRSALASTRICTGQNWEMHWPALHSILVSTSEHALQCWAVLTGQHWKLHLHICTRTAQHSAVLSSTGKHSGQHWECTGQLWKPHSHICTRTGQH